ncbi:MAG: hypothetical protein CUN55_00455 [Phototrophicales bacterium]|nr:MAG: hypothetical protein CUN55_00455 [Phototrophicales bacterium]
MEVHLLLAQKNKNPQQAAEVSLEALEAPLHQLLLKKQQVMIVAEDVCSGGEGQLHLAPLLLRPQKPLQAVQHLLLLDEVVLDYQRLVGDVLVKKIAPIRKAKHAAKKIVVNNLTRRKKVAFSADEKRPLRNQKILNLLKSKNPTVKRSQHLKPAAQASVAANLQKNCPQNHGCHAMQRLFSLQIANLTF